MRRLPLVLVIFSLAHPPAAYAGEPLLAGALRAADAIGKRQAPPPAAGILPAPDPGSRKNTPAAAAYAQGPGGAPARMSARGKTILGLGLAAAFAGIMLAIDGGVEDNTPSTKGERRNKL